MSADNLIVEDGSVVADANSYVDVDYFLEYLENRQLSLTTTSDHDHAASLLIRANDYIESKRKLFQGDKTSETQSIQFPRTGVYIDCILLDSATIPRELKYAQCRVAYDLDKNSLDEALPTILPSSKGNITKEKVDVIEKTYDNTGSRSNTPYYAEADALLKPLYKSAGLFAIKA